MTDAAYMKAIETRAEWLRWSEGPDPLTWPAKFRDALPMYRGPLTEGETFYMEPEFAQLVDHARQSIPDTMRFERDWLIRPAGFLYLAQPFIVPHLVESETLSRTNPLYGEPMLVRAVGWTALPSGMPVYDQVGGRETSGEGWTYFRCYVQNGDFAPAWARAGRILTGFSPWSFFVLRDGQLLGERIDKFETRVRAGSDPGGAYVQDRAQEQLHEIRWVYAAMHLMAQRLSVRVRRGVNRPTRRRLEHAGQQAPPFIEVVTLRRLQAQRKAGDSQPRDWQFQWEVRGHWRNQWYAKDGIHKSKFIEAFIKGPADKPFKEHGTKLFVARR